MRPALSPPVWRPGDSPGSPRMQTVTWRFMPVVLCRPTNVTATHGKLIVAANSRKKVKSGFRSMHLPSRPRVRSCPSSSSSATNRAITVMRPANSSSGCVKPASGRFVASSRSDRCCTDKRTLAVPSGDLPAVATTAFCGVHGPVRQGLQMCGVIAVLGVEGDADADT